MQSSYEKWATMPGLDCAVLMCNCYICLAAAQALTLVAVLVQNNKMLHTACSVALRSLLALLLQLRLVCNSGDTAFPQHCCQCNTVLNIVRGKQFLRAPRVGGLLQQDSTPMSQRGQPMPQRLVSLKSRPRCAASGRHQPPPAMDNIASCSQMMVAWASEDMSNLRSHRDSLYSANSC